MPHNRHITTLRTDLVLDTGDYPALLAAAVKEADRLGYRDLARPQPCGSAWPCSWRRAASGHRKPPTSP